MLKHEYIFIKKNGTWKYQTFARLNRNIQAEKLEVGLLRMSEATKFAEEIFLMIIKEKECELNKKFTRARVEFHANKSVADLVPNLSTRLASSGVRNLQMFNYYNGIYNTTNDILKELTKKQQLELNSIIEDLKRHIRITDIEVSYYDSEE